MYNSQLWLILNTRTTYQEQSNPVNVQVSWFALLCHHRPIEYHIFCFLHLLFPFLWQALQCIKCHALLPPFVGPSCKKSLSSMGKMLMQINITALLFYRGIKKKHNKKAIFLSWVKHFLVFLLSVAFLMSFYWPS